MKYVILLFMLIITSCATTPTADSFCSLYTPVYYDSKNIDEKTLKSIRTNNAIYLELCTKTGKI